MTKVDYNKFFVSILICCYNSEKFIESTIKSVLNNDYKDFEIIFVDDGSKDRTKEIIHKTMSNYDNYIYYYQNNKGLGSARNKGVELANSNWLFILDHDDIIFKYRLTKQINDIKKNINCSVVFGDTLIDKLNNKTKYMVFHEKYGLKIDDLINKTNVQINLLKYGCFIGSSSTVINKKKALEIGCFNESLSFTVDYDFFVRSAEKFNFYSSQNIYSKWKIHENQITNKNYFKNNIELFYLYYSNFKNIKLSELNYHLLMNFLKIIFKILIYFRLKKSNL